MPSYFLGLLIRRALLLYLKEGEKIQGIWHWKVILLEGNNSSLKNSPKVCLPFSFEVLFGLPLLSLCFFYKGVASPLICWHMYVFLCGHKYLSCFP